MSEAKSSRQPSLCHCAAVGASAQKTQKETLGQTDLVVMEDWDNVITLLMILSIAVIIGVTILIWKLSRFRSYDSKRFVNYDSREIGREY